MAAAAFEQPVSLLFLDEGVWHLLPDQASGLIDAKSVEKTLASLSLYDIEALYADSASLRARGIATEDLVEGVSAVGSDQASELISKHERVLVF